MYYILFPLLNCLPSTHYLHYIPHFTLDSLLCFMQFIFFTSPINSTSLNTSLTYSTSLNTSITNSTSLNSSITNSTSRNTSLTNSTSLNTSLTYSTSLNTSITNSTFLNTSLINSTSRNTSLTNSAYFAFLDTYRFLVKEVNTELRARLSFDTHRVTKHDTGWVTVHFVVADDLETCVVIPSLIHVFLSIIDIIECQEINNRFISTFIYLLEK